MVNKFDTEGSAAAGRFLGHQMALMARLTFPIVALLVGLSAEIGGVLLPADHHRGLGTLFPIIALSVLLPISAPSFSRTSFTHIRSRGCRWWRWPQARSPQSLNLPR